MTLLSFLSCEVALASPERLLSRSDKLAPETLFTKSDKDDSFGRVAAKYIELEITANIKGMPLAGVEALLNEIRDIAVEKKYSGRSFNVTGGAAEGQVIIQISDSYALRFYNPKMAELISPLSSLSVLQEYPLNKYVSFQFWGSSKDSRARAALGEGPLPEDDSRRDMAGNDAATDRPVVSVESKVLPARAKTRRAYSSAVRSDMDVVLYYLQKVMDQDLDLIRLSAERATLERKTASGDMNEATRNALDECLSRLKALTADIEKECAAMPERKTALSTTGGRDYRKEASERIRRAITFIERKNEPAACALLSSSYRVLSEELEALSKVGGKPSFRRRVWMDSRKDMLNVMKGGYESHEIEGGRTVQVLTRKPQQSTLTWQGIRSCDEQLDGMLNEMEWIRASLPQLDALIASGRKRIREERSVPGNQFSRVAFTPAEHASAEMLLKGLQERTGKAIVPEKMVGSKASGLALELLSANEERGAVEMMSTVKGMLSAREEALHRMVMAVWAGKDDRESRLQLLRERVHRRNSRLIWKTNNALNALAAGNIENAGKWIDEIAGRDGTDKGEYAAMREPEFSRMVRVLKDAQGKLDLNKGAAKRDLEIFRERVRLAELLDSFMQDLRDQYVEARLNGAPANVLDSLFIENFNRYLDFARENNIGRGSPRVLFAMFYLPVYVSMTMPDPEHPSKEVANPAFKAFLVLARLLEVNDIPALIGTIEKTQARKYSNLLVSLKACVASGIKKTDALEGQAYRDILTALANDLNLMGAEKKEFLEASAVPANATALADISRREVYFNSMFGALWLLAAEGKLHGPNTQHYRGLEAFAKDPAVWLSDIKAPWEMAFIRRISSLSSEDLAEKFLTYQPQQERTLKDLRRVSSIHGYRGSTLNDIYMNILNSLEHLDVLKEEDARVARESLWIVREWVYRHWDGAPKERSIDIIDRAAGLKRPGVPPKGSIYGVLKYMCDEGMVGETNIQYGTTIANGLGRAYATIEPDLRALVVNLHLLEKVNGVRDRAYYVSPRVAAMAERILPILERFRGDLLRPSAEELEAVYVNEIEPILRPSDLDIATVVSMASFGHGTNQATEVMSTLNGAVGFVELIGDEAQLDKKVAAVVMGDANILSDLKYSLNTFAKLFQDANAAVHFNGLNKIDIAAWRSDAKTALARLKKAKTMLDENRDYFVYGTGNAEAEELFNTLQASILPELVPMLEDRVMLATGELSSEVVDLNDVFTAFHENLIIKARQMTRESISLEPAEVPVLVKGNRLSLISMVCNIASNAACYSYSLHGDDADVRLMLFTEDDNAVIRISDNGPGMTGEQLEKLKMPFYTTGGTGIGVTEAFATAKLHGGSIDVESTPHVGSIITIRIPLARGITVYGGAAALYKGSPAHLVQDAALLGNAVLRAMPPADTFSLDVYYDMIYGEYVDIAQHGWMGQVSQMYQELFETSRDPATWPETVQEDWEMGFIEEISLLPAESLAELFKEYNPVNSRRDGNEVDLRKICGFCMGGNFDELSLEDVYGKLNFLLSFKGNKALIAPYSSALKAKIILREWIYRHWNALPRENSYEVMTESIRSRSRSKSALAASPSVSDGGPNENRMAPVEAPYSVALDSGKRAESIVSELRTSVSSVGIGGSLSELSFDYYRQLDGVNDAHTPAGYGDVFKEIRDQVGFDGKSMVEIGPAYGVFMYALAEYARREGFSLSLKGIESDPVAAKIARTSGGLDVVTASVNDVPDGLRGAKFDVVFERFPYFDLMEPAEIAANLAACYSLTSPGGLCVIATPVRYEAMDGADKDICDLARAAGFDVTAKKDVNGYLLLSMRRPVMPALPVEGEGLAEVKSISGRLRTVVPELVNGLMTAVFDKKSVVLAIDDDLGPGPVQKELEAVVEALKRLTQRDDELGKLLKNVVVRHGKGATLAAELSSVVSRGGVKKENIIVITTSDNAANFSSFEGTSTMTVIDDSKMSSEFYYPLVEIALFTVARAIGYDRESLLKCYRNIPNAEMLDDSFVLDACWDAVSNAAKPTVAIRLIPGAVKAADKAIYREVAKFITTAA